MVMAMWSFVCDLLCDYGVSHTAIFLSVGFTS